MATLKAADPWATESAPKPAPAPVPVVGPGYNLRLVLDAATLGRLRAVAVTEDRPLRVMALRLLRAQLEAIEDETD